MQVVHSNIEKEPVPQTDFKPKDAYEQFCYEQSLKGWRKAIKDNAASLAIIHELYPGWYPPLVILGL